MKKIIPFSNVLEFKTAVSEITAISLEHQLKKSSDSINGTFIISGEYKITKGDITPKDFAFSLPFDIALGNNYNLETIIIDIDDFRYELINSKELKVDIDLYLDGEIIKEPVAREEPIVVPIIEEREDNHQEESIQNIEKNNQNKVPENNFNIEEEKTLEIENQKHNEELSNRNIDLDIIDSIIEGEEMLKEDINFKKNINDNNENTIISEKNNTNDNNTNNINEKSNVNIFNNISNEEKYVTYRIYNVTAGDTLDSIISKYETTKETLAEYNNIDTIHQGDKLLIPTNEK